LSSTSVWDYFARSAGDGREVSNLDIQEKAGSDYFDDDPKPGRNKGKGRRVIMGVGHWDVGRRSSVINSERPEYHCTMVTHRFHELVRTISKKGCRNSGLPSFRILSPEAA
jgi:hypothetical protein